MRFSLILLSFTWLITGCQSTKSMYEYGSYSDDFYEIKREPSSESYTAWKKSLEDIITKSAEKKLRVPPGVYANLGYIYLQSNNYQSAVDFFKKEKATYPESSVFIDRLIEKVDAAGEQE